MPSEAVVEAASGAIGSILALIATYPLKTIYTLQALNTSKDGKALLSMLDIISKYRLKGLYVGISPNILESGISSAVYFYLYSRLRNLAVRSRQQGSTQPNEAGTPSSSKDQQIDVLSSLLVAAVAGIGNQLVTMPASVVATRMQAQSKVQMELASVSGAAGSVRGAGSSSSAWAVISRIWTESGLGGFWSGLLPALVLVVNPAVQYMLYEQLLNLFKKWKAQRVKAAMSHMEDENASCCSSSLNNDGEGKKECRDTATTIRLSAGEIFVASALAKIGATVVTYPMIVVKSRMQASSKSNPHHSNTLGSISRIFQDEGPSGFFKGLRAKILQTALNAAMMLMLKEQCFSATQKMLSGQSMLLSPIMKRNLVA
ncbi:hypothetical protein CEUSTIGMA_g9426.t1 [Chlamydomonas eustigma]|uniref:Uncharacterized protein n=1 Tax=Chlamydomonas eustigma TaxID=1157962 RepID=A0A250XFZ2_9CHLO|nr:hypothetical protein CEUSTIGMA_g9426.t1 [Chlamydomonas eustigma]|eukprot:GAX81998.1 hypothetical protein CEUSTIGMA_g9426.t1 [Chlamydomonas eustigma]